MAGSDGAGDSGQRIAPAQTVGSKDVSGQISIAELEPTRVIKTSQRCEAGMGISFHAPAMNATNALREGVCHRIEIGRNVQAEEGFIVGRIDDER
jgi:hypothetical protein